MHVLWSDVSPLSADEEEGEYEEEPVEEEQ